MTYESVQEMFSRIAALSPDSTAVERGGRRLSYSALERESNRLANFLLDHGARRGSLVGLLTTDPALVITGILAALKAAAVFVPLDPSFPERRLAALSAQAPPEFFLTEPRHLARLGRVAAEASARAQVICVGAERGDEVEVEGGSGAGFEVLRGYEAYERTERPGIESDPEGPCSIYFTSGSTGRPKAILGRLKGIDHFVRWEIEAVGARAGTRVSQLASPSFDGFLKDAFVPLCSGGVVCAPESRDVVLDAQGLADWLDAEGVEVLHCVPSVFRSLINQGLSESYFGAMRWVVLTGEPLYPADVKRWMEVFGQRIKLWNIYGTTETSLSKFAHEVRPEDAERPSIPVGRPIKGAAVIVINSRGQLCREEAIGEIYIRTPYRSHGYYGEPQLTAEVFVPNPFGSDPADLLHRTGDFGRLLPGGELELLGRRDQQVKVRGVRVELGEIENLLRGHEAVADVAVVDREDGEGGKTLVAYVSLANGSSTEQVRSYLAERVPEAMVPSAIVEMERLPRTLNGKIDRKALPALEQVRTRRGEGGRVRGPVEEIVAGVWAEVLRVPVVGRGENFFNLGGHSLLVTQVLTRVREFLAVELPVRSLFEAPTVEEFSRLVEQQLSEGGQRALEPIERVPREGELPLSFAQQRLWFQEKLAGGSGAFHINLGVKLKGSLNVAALEQSFAEVMRRHENLRTTFPMADGELTQVISQPPRLTIPVVDLRRLPAPEREAAGRRLAEAELNRPFDLESGPLVRAVLIRHGADEHTVVCVMHHIISDGWSRGLLVKEISALYEAFSQGQPSPLRELSVQYADFAAWQRRRLQGDALKQELDYWKKSLAGAPPLLNLATDRPRPATQTYRGAAVAVELPGELSERLKALSHQQGVTLFMTLLAAFKTLLYRYTSQEDIVVGTTVANRERADIEGLIGFFVNILALRTDCSGNPRFQELLRQVRETALKAYAYQGTPFERLLQELQTKRNPSYSPLFQVAFSLQNQPTMATLELPGLTLSVPEAEVTTTQFDILLDMFEDERGLSGLLQYNTDLFDRSTMVRMAGHFRNLLEGVASGPERRLSELPLLSEEERERVLVEWNRTRAEYPRESCVHELFEARAEAEPDRVAVSFRGEHLSYAELNRRANKVARHLRAAGIKTGDLVGVCMGHSPEEVVALLGALKAGAGYVPLDPEQPPQRLAFVLRDACASVVLTERRFADALLACGARAVCLDSDWPSISQQSGEALGPCATPRGIAYVIYTSGSTGEPKGVAVRHAALVNYVWWAKDVYLRGERLDFPLYSSLAFDLTVTSLYVPLVTGNRVVVYRQEGHEPLLTEILEADEVGVLKLTPGHLSLIKERDNTRSGVRRLVVGGEALTTKLAREVYESFGRRVEIYNEYGPTEATVGCMIHRFDAESEKRPFVPIGRAAPNARIYLLDRGMSPQAENMLCEIFIAGEGLAEGYWNRPDLTAERFVPDTFTHCEPAGQRMYRTGDHARLLPGGTLEFVGRADDQVKLRGYRIEPGEVEAALAGHEAVAQSAVLLREDAPGDRRLVAYVVFAEGTEPTAAELQQFLRERLPAYMVPSAFVQLEALPLTRNGKVDRAALPAPAEGFGRTLNLSVAYQEPRTEMETALAGMWREVLGVAEVGVYDDFFALGGYSLLATQIVNRVNQTFQIDLPVRAIFDDPTVAGLSLLIEETLIEKLKAAPEPV